MLRMSLLATLAFSLWQTAAYAQMSHHQHASEAACEDDVLALRVESHPAFAPDGTLWLAWMAGGQISVASSKRSRAQLFDAGPGDEGKAQPRLGTGCASQDRRREKWRHRTGVFAVQGQGVQRSGARHEVG